MMNEMYRERKVQFYDELLGSPSKLIGLSNSRTDSGLGFFFFFFLGAEVSAIFRPLVSIGSRAQAIVAIRVTMP